MDLPASWEQWSSGNIPGMAAIAMNKYTYEDLLILVEQHLAANPYTGQPAELYEPVNYLLSLGGKRLRPVLALMGCALFGGDVKKALQPAIGLEVFHNFTLMHDDIMDQAPLRRGHATVHSKWNEPTAILSGDLMLIKAIELMLQVDDAHIRPVMELFNRTAAEVCEGQQWDMNFETRQQVSVNDYLEMIRLKTAVLLGCSLKTGAIVANAAPAAAQKLYDYGVNIGIGFQLMDDVLDVFGQSDKVGKQVGGDILSNKKTFLLLKAFELADAQQKEMLHYWTGLKQFDASEKVSAIMYIYRQLNIQQLATAESEKYFTRAQLLLEELDIAAEAKNSLSGFADYLKTRIH